MKTSHLLWRSLFTSALLLSSCAHPPPPESPPAPPHDSPSPEPDVFDPGYPSRLRGSGSQLEFPDPPRAYRERWVGRTRPEGSGVAPPELHPRAVDALAFVAGVYTRRGRDLQFDGERPEPIDDVRWHAHGYFARSLVLLRGGRRVTMRIHKRRWRLVGTTRTCHSRPPDDPVLVRHCTLIVVLRLWCWLSAREGLLRHRAWPPDLEHCGTPRTLQRWLRKALPMALEVQQAVRHALIDKSEPRPVERLFPRVPVLSASRR